MSNSYQLDLSAGAQIRSKGRALVCTAEVSSMDSFTLPASFFSSGLTFCQLSVV